MVLNKERIHSYIVFNSRCVSVLAVCGAEPAAARSAAPVQANNSPHLSPDPDFASKAARRSAPSLTCHLIQSFLPVF